MYDRQAMLVFLKGDGNWPEVDWPAPIMILLEEARDEYGDIREEYREFLLMLFANSPIPLLLQVRTKRTTEKGNVNTIILYFQAGANGARKDLLNRLINRSLRWKEEELAIQREFPTLYRSLRPLLVDNTFPPCVISALDYIQCESDYLLHALPHDETKYGPPLESRLESFPLWPLERGMTTYTKDKKAPAEDQLACAEKVIGNEKIPQ